MNTFKPQVLDGHFTLHDLNVDGNVDVTHINGVDMKKLDTMVVKTSGDFTLSGKCGESVTLMISFWVCLFFFIITLSCR